MKQEQNNPPGQRHVQSRESRPAQVPPQKLAARQVFRCANCEIEFFWPPTVVQGKIYCCTGCAAGGPCNCDYSLYRSITIFGVIYYDL